MPIQPIILIITIDTTPNAPVEKFELIIVLCIPFECSDEYKNKQNIYVFKTADKMLANDNMIPIDAPNSGPIDRERMK